MSRLEKYKTENETNKAVKELIKTTPLKPAKKKTKLANFNVEVELWDDIQTIAKLQDTTATKMIIEHLENIRKVNGAKLQAIKDVIEK